MDNVHSIFIKPESILTKYKEKFEERFAALSTDMNSFISAMGYENDLKVDQILLGCALMDYFEDIERLKLYHHVKHVNAIKVVSHISFWLLRRRPIQVINPKREYVDINERFVLTYILDFLSGKNDEKVLDRDSTGLTTFCETFLFFLKYRISSADMLELAITAFFAGQIYQNKETDLSKYLGKIEAEE